MFAHYASYRLKTCFDIEAILGLALLGQIPRIPALPERSSLWEPSPDPVLVRSFDLLRKAVENSESAQCIVNTSTVPGEGKTFITCNLAASFARAGERTIILDGDLHRPRVARRLGVRTSPGIIDGCSQRQPVSSIVVATACPDLDIIPAGGPVRTSEEGLNPWASGVLTGSGWSALLDELRSRYRRILIDTPPITMAPDALNCLASADGWIYSCHYNKAAHGDAEAAISRLNRISTNCLGAVLNGVVGTAFM